MSEKTSNEEKYRAIFLANRDALMILEPPMWKFTAGNPAAIEMFEAKDEADFLSYDPWRLSPETQPDGQPSIEKAKMMIEKAVKEGMNLFEWKHKRIGGEEFDAEVLLSKIELPESTFLCASVRDVTIKKLADAQLKKHDQELERFNQLMVGRELEMVKLKKIIRELKEASN